MMMSPGTIPAVSAGPPGTTVCTIGPSSTVTVSTPRYGCSTSPSSRSCGTIFLAVSIGTAKPIPTLPPSSPPPVRIAELMPMTRPAASISGPPELPGFSAASVWMTSSIWNPSGAWMRRWSADTTPVVSVRSRPNGLPIATVGSPTFTSADEPSASGRSFAPSPSTRSSATSVDTSRPTISASRTSSSANWTCTSRASWTTCAL